MYLTEKNTFEVKSPVLVTPVGVRNQHGGGDGRGTKQKPCLKSKNREKPMLLSAPFC